MWGHTWMDIVGKWECLLCLFQSWDFIWNKIDCEKESLFCNMRSNDSCGVWCKSAVTLHKVWDPFSLCFVNFKYCGQGYRSEGRFYQKSCWIIHLPALMQPVLFPSCFFLCCLPPLPLLTFHTLKNVLTQSLGKKRPNTVWKAIED